MTKLTPVYNAKRRLMPAAQRLEGKYKIDPSGCWIWTAVLDEHGYGRIHDGSWKKGTRRTLKATRVMYENTKGSIVEGLVLDHLCNTPSCVNPEHLEQVTQAENLRRAGERRTHCRRGHEFTTDNTVNRSIGRTCRKCSNKKAIERYHDRKIFAT